MSSDSMIRRKYSEGDIAMVPNVANAPYFLGGVLGSVASADSGDASGSVYEHTCTVQNANASLPVYTFVIEQGGEVTERYADCVMNEVTIEASDDYATMTASILGGFPDTSTLTESFTAETEFAYHQYTAKFGTSISNAEGQTATKLKGISININNNVLEDEAFLSGSNEPQQWIAGRLQVTGSYTLQFDGTTELDKYKNNTKNACVIQFTGADIGTSDSEEIRLDLAKLVLTAQPKEYNLDGIVLLTQEFEVEYDATDADITAIITNLEDGTDY